MAIERVLGLKPADVQRRIVDARLLEAVLAVPALRAERTKLRGRRRRGLGVRRAMAPLRHRLTLGGKCLGYRVADGAADCARRGAVADVLAVPRNLVRHALGV